jgi:hypothetical protein
VSLIHRRTFVERLGLGVGAWLLSPLARNLVKEAQGAEPNRRRLLLIFDGNGWDHQRCFMPSAFQSRNANEAFESRDFALPPSMAALAPYRNKLLVLDNARNYQGPTLQAGHYKGFMPATCMPHIGTAPGGPSIDQVIGRKLLHSNPYTAVNFAARERPGGLVNGIFAAGAGQPLPQFSSPEMATVSLFAPVAGTATGAALLAKRRRLLDVIKDDVSRLRSNLAANERLKLDQYTAALEDIGGRQQKLEAIKNCGTPVTAPGSGLEDQLAAHMDNAAAALICGLTQVATLLGPGTGISWAKLGISDTHALGHDNSAGGIAGKNKIYNFYAAQIARFAQKLAAIPEGNGNMFDNTIVFWSNHNAEGHHSKGEVYPTVLVGTAGGRIKADGRFIRFGARGRADAHSLAEVFCTIAHAMGAPTDTFGKGGGEPVNGPIQQLV